MIDLEKIAGHEVRIYILANLSKALRNPNVRKIKKKLEDIEVLWEINKFKHKYVKNGNLSIKQTQRIWAKKFLKKLVHSLLKLLRYYLELRLIQLLRVQNSQHISIDLAYDLTS